MPEKKGVPAPADISHPGLSARRNNAIAVVSIVAILSHLAFRFGLHLGSSLVQAPLLIILVFGGLSHLYETSRKLIKLDFGSDMLGAVSIITSLVMGEYLAGTIIVLMLSGGAALESYALRRASSALAALAKRMPSIAHRKADSGIVDIAIQEISIGESLIIFPHEICPVDGRVTEGHGMMDESYLTGEPFQITKTTGSTVISGAVNGESPLTISATKLPADSRHSKIMEVMRESEQQKPHLRRLGDRLGAFYTPFALLFAGIAWALSNDPTRFLAVLVIATPCPLLLAIPIAIMGAISLSAKRAIIVKNPVVLEQIASCTTAIFDKTGTLTYGEPKLTEQLVAPGMEPGKVLAYTASLERYSKHPLSRAILAEAKSQGVELLQASEVSEAPGQGLRGTVSDRHILVTSRKLFGTKPDQGSDQMPPPGGGLECIIAIDGRYSATFRFRDAPRAESRSFIVHLGPRHHFKKVMIVSGDRESEVRYLADQVGIWEIHSQQSPEEKLAIVRKETATAKTLYLGDGINDAPAMMAATVGMASGQNSDVTAEAAGVVILDNSLKKVDEFIHISLRMRSIALQSAIGGMALSAIGMCFAAIGSLSPVEGAIAQEVIDVLSIFNALRAAFPPKVVRDI